MYYVDSWSPVKQITLIFLIILFFCVYIYIYIYIKRERERERKRQTDRNRETQTDRQTERQTEAWWVNFRYFKWIILSIRFVYFRFFSFEWQTRVSWALFVRIAPPRCNSLFQKFGNGMLYSRTFMSEALIRRFHSVGGQ